MRRRSRRSRPINMLGAFIVEAGTMLAIVALAQPTWTRNLIEQISPASQASASSAQVDSVVSPIVATTAGGASASGLMLAVPHVKAMPSQAGSGWQQGAASAAQTFEPLRAMQLARDTTERLAMAGWSAQSMPVNEYSAAPQYSQYSVDPYATSQHYSSSPRMNPRSYIRPIYPPPASSQSMPAWSNSY